MDNKKIAKELVKVAKELVARDKSLQDMEIMAYALGRQAIKEGREGYQLAPASNKKFMSILSDYIQAGGSSDELSRWYEKGKANEQKDIETRNAVKTWSTAEDQIEVLKALCERMGDISEKARKEDSLAKRITTVTELEKLAKKSMDKTNEVINYLNDASRNGVL